MIVEVYHGDNHVASVNAQFAKSHEDALEFAYRWTQNIDGSWSKYGNPDWHPNVKVRAPLPVRILPDGSHRELGLRSSMIGDRMKIGDRIFTVAVFGFEETGAVVKP